MQYAAPLMMKNDVTIRVGSFALEMRPGAQGAGHGDPAETPSGTDRRKSPPTHRRSCPETSRPPARARTDAVAPERSAGSKMSRTSSHPASPTSGHTGGVRTTPTGRPILLSATLYLLHTVSARADMPLRPSPRKNYNMLPMRVRICLTGRFAPVKALRQQQAIFRRSI